MHCSRGMGRILYLGRQGKASCSCQLCCRKRHEKYDLAQGNVGMYDQLPQGTAEKRNMGIFSGFKMEGRPYNRSAFVLGGARDW